ncbi:MAG TPA: hypothetical protein DCP25_09095 [Chloroflexi bacterium]|jgi:hypothetical protein|nr:hypothetical protein [Chloroflexota bacterium]
MRALVVIPIAIVIAIATSGAANAADEVVCGRIMGYSGATATAPGSLVIPQPGDTAPAGTYIVIPVGAQFTYPGTSWACVRTTASAPTQVFGGFTSTRTFAGFVAPGSPGYRAEPAAPSPSGPVPTGRGSVGVLPGTSTAPISVPLMPLALSVSGLLALGVYALRRRALS